MLPKDNEGEKGLGSEGGGETASPKTHVFHH